MSTRQSPDPHDAPWPGPLLGLLLLLAVAALLLFPYRNFTTDDAFIHFRFARNLAAGEGFSYNAPEATYGDTSPLWVLLLAGLGERLVDWGVAPASPPEPDGAGMDAWRLASKLLDLLAITAALLLFAVLARRRIRTPRWGAAAVTALLLLDPWFLKWSLSGMETPLAVALALLALLLRDLQRNTGRLDPWTPLVLGAGYLVRPEFVLLGGALLVDVLLVERRRRRADLVLAAVLPALPVFPWLIYASSTFGTMLPDTLAARHDINFPFIYIITKLGKILGSTYLLPIVAGLVALPALLKERRDLFPLVSILLVLAFYLLWRVSVGARYVLVVSPFIVLLGYGALLQALQRNPRLRVGALLLAAAILIGIQLGAVRFVTTWPAGLDHRLFEIARWLQAETPPDAVVAVHEIGVIGFVSERRVLDLAALVSPDVEPVARTGSVARSIGTRHVDYLVWNSNESPDRRLLEEMAGRLEPLLVRQVHREASSHFGSWQYYTVYRVQPVSTSSTSPAPASGSP